MPSGRRDPVARLVWIGLGVTVLAFALQSAADLILVLGSPRVSSAANPDALYNSPFDLDRNNGIPDLLSTAMLLISALGAATLAAVQRRGQWAARVLAVVLVIVAVADALQAEPHANAAGISLVVTLVAAAILVVAVARRAPRRAAVVLILGLCLLAAGFKAGYWYDQFMNVIGFGDLRRGDLEYEFGIVIKQGLELLGWSLVAIGLWATVAVAPLARRGGASATDERPREEPDAERQPLDHVPPEQPARLMAEAMHPLEPQALQGDGSARLVAGEEAEGDAHADEPGLGQLGPQRAD